MRRALAVVGRIVYTFVCCALLVIAGLHFCEISIGGESPWFNANYDAANIMTQALLPAERHFLDGRFAVADGAPDGRFATLPELCGLHAVGGRWLDLMRAGILDFDAARKVFTMHHGYYDFIVHLPADGQDGTAPRPPRFIAYAVPRVPLRRVLAMREDGWIFQLITLAPADGYRPAWNALMGGKGWRAPPADGWKLLWP